MIMAPSEPPPYSQPVYNTETGCTLVTDILAKNQLRSIEPHDYQLEGICYALDGVDLVATMATGAGKTGFYCFLMLVIDSYLPSLKIQTLPWPERRLPLQEMCGVHWMLSGPFYVLPILVLRLERVIKEFSERPVRITYRIEDVCKFVRGALSRPIWLFLFFCAQVLQSWGWEGH